MPDQMSLAIRLAAAATGLLAAGSAHASFTVIKNYADWSTAAGEHSTIDFVFSTAQIVNYQYAYIGAVFPDWEEVAFAQPSLFLQDGWGCYGAIGGDGDVHIKFLQPVTAVGAWFPGGLYAKLYLQGQLIYSSSNLRTTPFTYGFGGIVSAQPFDEVVFWDADGYIAIDDILFAPPIDLGPGDIDGDGAVNGSDLAILLGDWGPGKSPADLNGDGNVDATDLAIVLGAWTG
jgi:hypothetical protein